MITYHIDPARRIITTRVSGPLTPANFAGYLAQLFRDPKFDASFDSLVVAMDSSAVPPPATAAIMAPLVRTWSVRRSGCRCAFALPDQEARQAAELALNEVRMTAVTTRCFLSEAAASAWLESTAGAPPAPPIAI